MTLSLWRSCHLILALISALFLVVASVTGVILSFEPMSQSLQPYGVISLDDTSLAETIMALSQHQKEIITITVTPDDFVTASFINEDGQSIQNYIHPTTGTLLGSVAEKNSFFSWVTNLHRSLFLKGIGRFFVGFASLMLCLIAVTGILLLAQRQGGFLKLYTKIHERNVNQRYHVILGRWLLLPIVIIAGTGIFLSAEKFALFPEQETTLDWNASPDGSLSNRPLTQLPFFKNTTLKEVRKITFPFSEFPEDYFEVSLTDREVLVQQYTGEIVSEFSYPFARLASRWSLQWHTGQGSIIWAIILLFSSASILFFISSGVVMFLKRRKKTKEHLIIPNKNECEYILLFGSESGSTYSFAKSLFKALTDAGKVVFLAPLNTYTTYPNARHLIVLTATYGDGEAPTNARSFEAIFSQVSQPNILHFSVIGFGSKVYDHFCRYAIRVDALLHTHPSFTPAIPLHNINEQSSVEIKRWIAAWSAFNNLNIHLSFTDRKSKERKETQFEVIRCGNLNQDETFIIKLRPRNKVSFQSGDLLELIPKGETKVRQYSIGKIDEHIVLAIKRHELGICSTYLSTLRVGDHLIGKIKENPTFHFPKTAPSVVFIANGTGIAPFLGMIQEAATAQSIHLFWGGQTEASFTLYQEVVQEALSRKNNLTIYTAFSKTHNKQYIQDVLVENVAVITKILADSGNILICGSLAMQNDVLKELDQITLQELERPLSVFENKGQLATDCY